MAHLLNLLAICVKWHLRRSSNTSDSSLTAELHSLSHCSTAWTCSKSKTSGVGRYSGGIHESRTGFEDRGGAGGIALLGFSFSLGDVYATRACVLYDAQPLRHARRVLAFSNPQPVAGSQPY